MSRRTKLEDNGLWYKKQYGKNAYYHMDTPSEAEIEFLPHSDLVENPKRIEDYINKNSAEYPQVGRASEKNFFFFKKKPIAGIELPCGFYKHKEGSFPFPERLEQMTIREESYFDKNALTKFVKKDIDLFLKSKDLYKEMGIIYKRGYLLYGPPGNGKTGFIRNLIANGIPKESHVIWLTALPSVSMIKSLKSMDTFKVLIIEEITSNNGDNYRVKQLLEFLDGEESPDNCIIIGTTNYPELLEKNIVDRPSRFDMNLEIKDPSPEETQYFFEKFLNRELNKDEVNLKGLSIAYIKEICLRHKMYGITLQECYDQLITNRRAYNNNFVEKNKMGLS